MRLQRFIRTAGFVASASVASFAQQPLLLTPDPMVVEPGQIWSVQFKGGAHVYGRFRITNPRNDVQCMVLDEEGMINFKGGHEYRGYYFSGIVAAGSLNLRLNPEENYFLVFSNMHSVLASATVVVKAEIYAAAN